MKHIFLILILLSSSTLSAKNLPLNLLKLPVGFSVSIFAEPVPDAREMTRGAKGTLFVGSRDAGKVYAIIPDASKPHGTQVLTIAAGLDSPNGVAFHQGSLYVAEISRILRFDNIEEHLVNPPKPVIITAGLPQENDHGWRFIGFGPDGKLYIAIGMPCNVCLKEDARFGTIMRMNPDGTHSEIFIKGIRNSVGFDWDPRNQKLWFTDNGRDYLGDNLPPDKLNFAPNQGMHFGFPYYDGNVPDPEFSKLHPSKDFTRPTFELPAHVAALGMAFYSGKMFPTNYHNQIFIAEHGSWNRSAKIGYQIIVVKLKDNKVVEVKPFVTGWLQGQQAWGRPVDTLVMPDGSLLISDDYAGVIYRVTYEN